MNSSSSIIFSAAAKHTADDLLRELNSSYGDVTSGTAPYKQVIMAAVEDRDFDGGTGSLVATIGVTAMHQSPYGDNDERTRHFTLRLEDVRRASGQAPDSFKHWLTEIAKELAADEERFRALWREGISDTTQQMAKLEKPVAAPKAASFKKR